MAVLLISQMTTVDLAKVKEQYDRDGFAVIENVVATGAFMSNHLISLKIWWTL